MWIVELNFFKWLLTGFFAHCLKTDVKKKQQSTDTEKAHLFFIGNKTYKMEFAI